MNSYISQRAINELCTPPILDDLAKARCFVELRKVMLSQRVPVGEAGVELRDRIASRLNFGLSGKTLERLAFLLDLPPAIQNGVATKAIPKWLAMRILQETPKTQQQIAADVMSGMHKTAIIDKYSLSTKPDRTPHAALASLLKAIIADLPLVAANVELLADSRFLNYRNVATISRAIKVLRRLCARHEAITSDLCAASPKFSNVAVRKA